MLQRKGSVLNENPKGLFVDCFSVSKKYGKTLKNA